MTLTLRKEDMYGLRGLCMLMIVLSHAASSVEPAAFGLLPQAIVARMGYLGCSVFFFLSGYGLLFSLTRGEGRRATWLLRHLRKLLLPFFFTVAVYAAGRATGLIETDGDVLCSALTLSLPSADLWFYKVILALYVLSFSVFWLRIPTGAKVSLMALCVGAYYVFARCGGWGEWWWNSVLCFPLGMVFAWRTGQKEALRLSGKAFAATEVLLLVAAVLFVRHESTLTALAFSLFAVLGTHIVSLRSRILRFIGTGSLFFYLLEVPVMDLRPALMPTGNYIAYSLLVLLLVALLRMGYEAMAALISKKIFKK